MLVTGYKTVWIKNHIVVHSQGALHHIVVHKCFKLAHTEETVKRVESQEPRTNIIIIIYSEIETICSMSHPATDVLVSQPHSQSRTCRVKVAQSSVLRLAPRCCLCECVCDCAYTVIQWTRFPLNTSLQDTKAECITVFMLIIIGYKVYHTWKRLL